jgi:tetratricopeptide (TPR) repeat protein
VTLRRIAWDAAKRHGRLVLYAKSPSGLAIDAIEEIVSLTNQTIYLFVDDLTDVVEEAERLMRQAMKKSWPLVVIAGARVNEWNIRCEPLHAFVDEQYELKYLSEAEIDGLLSKLETQGCLGFLASLTPDNRKHQLRDAYGRQLLVALHEATKNKSFRDIIRDEFLSIFPPEARMLYLDVCSLHRLGPPVRAGLIGRVHGIRFEDFQEQFLLPLEQVIDVQRDASIGDWVYKARHSYIAQIVYEEVLKSVEEKFENIMRIIGRLNPTYSYDREVISELVRASTLARDFKNRRHGDAIFEAAIASFGHEPFLLHQRGIYEMRLAETADALDVAERTLRRALELAPTNTAFQHSLAELALRRADRASDAQERATWRAKADNIATSLARNSTSSYAHHTLVKSAVAAVKEALGKAEQTDDELTHNAFSQAVKVAEERLRQGLQRFPNEPYLLTEEAALGAILRNADRALKALGKAFEKSPKSELVARRYARVLGAKGEHAQAVDILRRAIEHNPGSYALNFDIAQNIRANEPNADTAKSDLLLYHFQRSFSKGDRNYEALFWYARQLCIAGKQVEARPIFETLKCAPVALEQKRKVIGMLQSADGSLQTIYGVVYKLVQFYGFIRSDLASIEVYFDFAKESELLEALEKDDRVSFNLGFTLSGPCAVNVAPV